jgi:uncharacterized protein YbjQ (UPF0145 family)
MKTHLLCKILAVLLLVTALPSAQAAGRKINFNIEDAMKRMDLAEKLMEKSIALYWADQIPSRPIEKEISTDTYSRGANATLKSDLRACSNAFENIAETLIEDAERFGANAIIGIRSYPDELPDFSSETEYRCDVGAFRASVGFRVRFVRLAP